MSDHSACRVPADEQAYMPTRILDIGEGDDGSLEPHLRRPIRLLRSEEVSGDTTYACLSHMWASSGQNITTTQATYEQHKADMPFHALGLVYQDTVHVLRRLGVRYVWIDSLCIVQDDAADWEHESKEMAKVYGKALFTLMNHDRMTGSLRQTGCQAQIISSASVSPPVYVRTELDHLQTWLGHSDVRNRGFRLLQRGWIYQERLLSPRVLHFTHQEIVWECLEEADCQCVQKDMLRRRENVPAVHPKLQHAEALGLTTHSRVPNEDHLRARWRYIISEYSGLNLTKVTDRLPALQGCADQIREKLDDQYSFGLWAGSSPQDLVWRAHPTSRKYGNRKPPELFQLPTWSWASVCASVSVPEMDPLIDYSVLPKFSAQTQPRSASRVVLKEFQDDPCPGQTFSYWLITGQMLPARLARTVAHKKTSSWRRAEKIELRIDSKYIAIHAQPPDYPGYEFNADFKFFNADWDSDDEYDVDIVHMLIGQRADHCLVLWRYGKAIPGTGLHRTTPDGHAIYQRIGVVEFKRDDPHLPCMVVDWDNTTECTIALE